MSEDNKFRVPRLNSLRSFSAKNLTGQAGVSDEYRPSEIERSYNPVPSAGVPGRGKNNGMMEYW